MPGLHCVDLSYASPHEPLAPRIRLLHQAAYEPNETVQVRWVRHSDDKPRPTIIFLHSWMAGGSVFEETVLLPKMARKLGVNIARLELPYHGKRRPPCSAYSGEYFWTADLTRTVEAIRRSVADARALLRFLEEETDGTIGVLGQSLGGIVSLALTCVETDLQFSIPVAAHLDLAGVLQDATLLRPMAQELAAQGWTSDDVDAYMQSMGLVGRDPAIHKDRILLIAGKYDRFLTADRVRALWRLWDKPAIHWYPGGHLGIFTHMNGYLPIVRDFLRDRGLDGSRDNVKAHSPSGTAAA
jgi:pimeloyl-ACP methyl ester carboxylesterase